MPYKTFPSSRSAKAVFAAMAGAYSKADITIGKKLDIYHLYKYLFSAPFTKNAVLTS